MVNKDNEIINMPFCAVFVILITHKHTKKHKTAQLLAKNGK
ncbi:hypothetical protein MNBD_BACTEROID03-2317 [hydrothermal vent metagenome]|uniref:Uncharacterized protein n=1 Tax=hydrothermal vent metagenome TaxID=652676 RepID=A0A3B0TS58_9ZZZZ